MGFIFRRYKKIIKLIILILLTLKSCITVTHADSSKLISLNFQDISIRAALQIIAEFSHHNIIANDNVKGNITLHLDNMPWEQAFDILLQTQNLAKRMIGDVIFVAPLKDILLRDKELQESQQQMMDLAPLQSELFHINYGKAADIVTMLKGQGVSLLSTRGTITVDNRTNTIWIIDTAQKISSIKKFIAQLDTPVKQVLIAAKIVYVNCNFEHELGIHFSSIKTSISLNNGADPIPPQNQRLNFDLPMDKLPSSNPELALARLGTDTLLDLELSALESEGGGRVISSPRLLTADQQTAQIQSGEEIPYQQSSSSGATNIAFKEAVLSLNVTPQVTPNGKIMLTLKLNQDKVGSRLVQGVPSIDTREIETQILVDDRETIVLGGIYEVDNSKQFERVPFLSAIPLVGHLFKRTSINKGRKELLIFVTPHIV